MKPSSLDDYLDGFSSFPTRRRKRLAMLREAYTYGVPGMMTKSMTDRLATSGQYTFHIGTPDPEMRRLASWMLTNEKDRLKIVSETAANRIVVTPPMAMAVHESCLPTKPCPIAKAIKKGDHAAAVTMPRRAASAAILRRALLAFFGTAAESRASAPVFMTPPKTFAAKWNPPDVAEAGNWANASCVR